MDRILEPVFQKQVLQYQILTGTVAVLVEMPSLMMVDTRVVRKCCALFLVHWSNLLYWTMVVDNLKWN